MMIGVAQVIGIKPILRSFFSGAPPWANASRATPIGRTEEIAAIAVAAPTVFRNCRREAAAGKTARRTAASTTRFQRSSSPAGVAVSPPWSGAAWLPPQEQRRPSRVRASNGSSNIDILQASPVGFRLLAGKLHAKAGHLIRRAESHVSRRALGIKFME